MAKYMKLPMKWKFHQCKIYAVHQAHWFVSACHFNYKDVPVHMLNLQEIGNLRLSNFKATFGKPLYMQQADIALN